MTQRTAAKTAQPGPYRDVYVQAFVRATWLLVPAWTFDFGAAWLFLAVMLGGDLATRRYLVRHDPAMVERRRAVKHSAETRGFQRFIYLMVNVLFLGALALAGVDHRQNWSSMPVAISGAGFALVAAGLYVVFRAFKANTYASATVTLHADHHVISSGPYGLVRHPMYSGLLLMMLGAPLALGSWWALLATAAFALAMAGRMSDEEKFLSTSLTGYREYTQRVRHRVIPSVW